MEFGFAEKEEGEQVIEQYSQLQKIKTDMASLQKLSVSPDLNGNNVLEKRANWVNGVLLGFGNSDATAQLLIHYETILAKWEEKLKGYTDLSDDEKDPVEKAKIEFLAEKVEQSDFPQLVTDLLTLYDWLVPSSFTFESDPIYPEENADEVEVNISIEPRPGIDNTLWKKRQFTHILPIKGGWKLDFSSGITGLAMPEQSYIMVAVPDTQLVTLKVEKSDKLNFGLSALLHAHYRSAGYFTGGVSVGVAVGQDQGTRYLVGGSLFIGRKERMVATAGIAFGKVNKLSNSQTVDTQYPLGTAVETVSRYRVGGFLGISYNLGK